MPISLVLTEVQAAAVYDAQVKLDEAGGRLHARIPMGSGPVLLHVKQTVGGTVQVWQGDSIGHYVGRVENYGSWAAFCEAYKI